jgi:hypothetical protein
VSRFFFPFLFFSIHFFSFPLCKTILSFLLLPVVNLTEKSNEIKR